MPRAQQPVHDADGGIERAMTASDSVPVSEDVAGQDLLEVLGALRGAVDQQDRGGGGDHVDDADQRFLRDARRPRAREGEQDRREQREGERIAVGRRTERGMAEHEGDRRAERRDLRQREIDEHDVAGQHLDAEIGVDADEAEGHQKRRPQKRRAPSSCALRRRQQRGDVGVEQRKIVVAPGSAPTDAASTTTLLPVRFARKATSRLRLMRLAHDDARLARLHLADQRRDMKRRRRHAGLRLDEADEIEAESPREIGPAVVIGDERNAVQRREPSPPTP